MKMNKIGVFICFLITMACNPKKQPQVYINSETDLFNWYKSNIKDFSTEKTVEFLRVNSRYIPSSIIQFKETGEIDSSSTIDYSKFEYFTLELSILDSKVDFLKSGQSYYKYQELVDYLSYKIKSDIQLNVGDTIINCKNVVFERSFGIKPSATLNLIFDAVSKKGARKIVYNDKIFNLGIIKLKVVEEDFINSIPIYSKVVPN